MDIEETVQKVQKRLATEEWCDWEVVHFDKGSLVVGGGTSLSYPHKLRLTFKAVDVFVGKFAWTTEGSDGLYVPHGDEARILNGTYNVESGHRLFVFVDTHMNNMKIVIAARSVEASGVWLENG